MNKKVIYVGEILNSLAILNLGHHNILGAISHQNSIDTLVDLYSTLFTSKECISEKPRLYYLKEHSRMPLIPILAHQREPQFRQIYQRGEQRKGNLQNHGRTYGRNGKYPKGKN